MADRWEAEYEAAFSTAAMTWQSLLVGYQDGLVVGRSVDSSGMIGQTLAEVSIDASIRNSFISEMTVASFRDIGFTTQAAAVPEPGVFLVWAGMTFVGGVWRRKIRSRV